MLSFTNFRFIKTVGVGTFGRVYLVQLLNNKITTPKYYALKMLFTEDLLRLRQLNHYENEVEILIMCKKHPFIVELMLNTKMDTYQIMLMEYVPGGELFSWIRKYKQFDIKTIRFYGAQILLALKFLHDKGIVFRDLKPENILISKDGYIKLTDFGFASKMEVSYTFCGTPEYMSPEQLNNEKSSGHGREVDYWSFGIVLYEMYKGIPPFFSQETFNVYYMISNDPVHFDLDFDPVLKDLLTKLLEKKRENRLGHNNGISEIMEHPFFAETDFDGIYHKKYKAPIIPSLQSDHDTSYFINYSEKIDPKVQSKNQNIHMRMFDNIFK